MLTTTAGTEGQLVLFLTSWILYSVTDPLHSHWLLLIQLCQWTRKEIMKTKPLVKGLRSHSTAEPLKTLLTLALQRRDTKLDQVEDVGPSGLNMHKSNVNISFA